MQDPERFVEGQTVLYFRSHYGRGPRPEPEPWVVTRVARKYFYAQPLDRPLREASRFERDTGRAPGTTNYYAYVLLPEEYEKGAQEAAVRARLRAHGIDLSTHGATYTSGLKHTAEFRAALATLADEHLALQQGLARPDDDPHVCTPHCESGQGHYTPGGAR